MSDNKENHEEGKSLKERHKHDPLSGITGGLILILLGTIFLLATLDYIGWGDWWPYFLMGLGAILILEVIIRSTISSYRQDITGKLIGGVVLIVIGGAFQFGMSNWWPLILIAVGVILLFSSLWKVKKSEE